MIRFTLHNIDNYVYLLSLSTVRAWPHPICRTILRNSYKYDKHNNNKIGTQDNNHMNGMTWYNNVLHGINMYQVKCREGCAGAPGIRHCFPIMRAQSMVPQCTGPPRHAYKCLLFTYTKRIDTIDGTFK